MALIDKYEVSEEKKESLNEVTNMWNAFRIKNTIQYLDIWFNELFNLNLNFIKIMVKYDKEEDDIKAHVFDVLPGEYNHVHLSCNINRYNMA